MLAKIEVSKNEPGDKDEVNGAFAVEQNTIAAGRTRGGSFSDLPPTQGNGNLPRDQRATESSFL